jgi:hypothetical protein
VATADTGESAEVGPQGRGIRRRFGGIVNTRCRTRTLGHVRILLGVVLVAVLIVAWPSSAMGAVPSWLAWSQDVTLTLSSGLTGDYLGYSVALSGDTAIVGAYGTNRGTGAAYVFTRSGPIWSQAATLTASDGALGNRFGYSVALSGDTAIVGAYGRNSGTGAAYVFTRSGTVWSQTATLTASGGAVMDRLGYSVALSGDTAIAGAHGRNRGTGAAYVFTRSGSVWSQTATLTALSGAEGDALGYSVALSGDTAIVGAYGTNRGTGAAYVFTRSGPIWSQAATLTASDGVAGDSLGYSVALSGDTAIAGAPLKDNQMGAVYVFTRSGSDWSRTATLTASDRVVFDNLGRSVALTSGTAIAGAFGRNTATGAAYVFTRSGPVWSQAATLTASDGVSFDNLGHSVALSGDTAIVGAYGRNEGTGAAYIFSTPATPPAVASVRVGRPVTRYRVRHGRRFQVFGTVGLRLTPGTYPVVLDCYRYEGGEWVFYTSYRMKAYRYPNRRKYAGWIRLPVAGRWRLVARYVADPLAVSSPRFMRVW